MTSETFLQWDVQRLSPSDTVVVSDPPPRGETVVGRAAWDTAGAPSLTFDPLPGDPAPSLERQQAVREFLAKHGVEVVLVEYFDFADRWFDLLRSVGVRVWVRGHGVDLSARLRDSYWREVYLRYAAADGLIVPSARAAERLIDLGLPRERLRVVRCCVEIPPTRPATPVHPRSRQVRCVAVGRLVPKKAPLLLLESFADACRADSRLRLDLVGDGPLMPDVQRFIDAHGLTNHVSVHGRLPHEQALALIRGADIMLHHAVTSSVDGDAEGLPVSILEAMGAEAAVIGTRHEGIPEVINDGVNGLLVGEGDVHGMGRAIVDLADDARRRRRLGTAARQSIIHGYTEARARGTLLSLLRLPAPARTPGGDW
ncbi:glycosyltransferase family 4 protein [Streptomyces sp. CBMA123]|uniref:glycosyltransferase family 4 protein n=1 Tax=Streptomyces sp. CBMA123 TaxID=1896313 RepID=UPI00294FF3C6|nr:glycosyltransferase family 4 protein [Streptomyces sp. CBMA123]